ncbi:MAG: hypothetical protein N3A01_04670 [Bacteroidales bacterium]|nr:hypothetical protein [Bacteroidales bacterium]
MKISGFTIARNAQKLYFPIKESILSILPLVDEYIIALGEGDVDDDTEKIINSINSTKIKIYKRKWNKDYYKFCNIFAEETNFALSKCTGDWCFYLQADEVVHENDLNKIEDACKKFLANKKIDGLLFKYLHFWGDYNHYLPFHGWYKNEIRIIRNNSFIYSYKDAQSFRKNNNEKLNVAEINACIYHYGWVRPPEIMATKKIIHDEMYQGQTKTKEIIVPFNYGNMNKIPVFKGTHPKVMTERIKNYGTLNYWSKKLDRKKFKHEKFLYRLISYIENNFLFGKQLFGYKNWKIIERFK